MTDLLIDIIVMSTKANGMQILICWVLCQQTYALTWFLKWVVTHTKKQL